MFDRLTNFFKEKFGNKSNGEPSGSVELSDDVAAEPSDVADVATGADNTAPAAEEVTAVAAEGEAEAVAEGDEEPAKDGFLAKVKGKFAACAGWFKGKFSKKNRAPKRKYALSPTASHLPEHGPVDENGREILLSLRNVDITFGKGDKAVRAVKNASFDIYKGETFSLVGESGSGKTTIGRAVIRVNPCADGEILYKGVRISGKIPHSLDREVIRNIQMVFQDPAASLNERATVEYIVSEGLYNFHLYENEADRVKKVENIIEEVGLLPEHLTRYPHEFSGGQRQRIGLARAMVMDPQLVVADEPISALDVSIRAQVLNLLKKFQNEKGITYLFIAHDLSIVRFISDRIGVIYKGDIVEIAEAEELFNFPMHPYTHALISAIPIPDPQLEKHKVLYTYDPSVHDYSEDKPEMVNIGHDHYVYGNKKEIAEYKALRDKEVPLKTIKVVKTEKSEEEKEKKRKEREEATASHEPILDSPVHDTGSAWYAVLSFFLPILGLIAFPIFKAKHYYRNYKACKKGTIIGWCVIAAIVVIFCILLISSLVKC